MIDDLPLTPPVPSWNDLFLRFVDADAANAALLAAGVLTETLAMLDADGNVLIPAGYAPAQHATIDTVGVIYRPTGNEIETELGPQPEMAPLDGWHVNVRLPADYPTPESLTAYQVAPANPVRIWA
jgi:hypothetical protein